ncbi:hypothetical protein ES705_22016 [subsurface metagenome]
MYREKDMKRLLHIIDRISIWSGGALSFLIAVAMFIVIYEILVRAIFCKPTLWAFDSTIYCCGTVYIVGGAYTLYKNAHVKMDLVTCRLSQRIRSILDLISFPFFVIFCGVILWKGWQLGLNSFMIKETLGTAWNVPLYPLKLVVAFGGLLILLQGLVKFVRDLAATGVWPK